MADPTTLSARALQEGLAARRLDWRDVLAAFLARAQEAGARHHVFAHFDPAVLDPARRPAPPAGPLFGLPLGVKDIFETEDMPTAYGSPIWAGHRPRADAAPVALARAAGAIVIGKTVTTEFAYRHPGPTTHPKNPAHTPGGSSSGSAAGVALGCFPLALGTQTAGSVIRPAAYCGVVGYKPSYGWISRAGVKPLAESFDTVGLFARTVGDCALLGSVLAGKPLGDPEQKREAPPRLILYRGPAFARAEPETRALFEALPGRLARAGARVVERALPPFFEGLLEDHALVMNAEAARALAWEWQHHRDRLSPALCERLAEGESASPAAWLGALRRLESGRRQAMGLFEGGEVLVVPAAPGEAPEGLGFTGEPVFNALWTALHLPALTVPAGEGRRGLPLGVQLIAPWGEDARLLAVGAWVAAALAG
jgi:Asp-tRNA(Asn)/Glu-tRNA(Gln) amidotransferase A subunit family amidase